MKTVFIISLEKEGKKHEKKTAKKRLKCAVSLLIFFPYNMCWGIDSRALRFFIGGH